MTELNPLNHPICLMVPQRLVLPAWQEHTPFAMFLVDALRPKLIVELGTHYGDSYCAFCQAVSELRLDTECCAVDTWQGDQQAGLYGPEVLADLRSHHDPLYGGFSRLIQSTFDGALGSFADGTIDLLHIDGCHTYDAVRRDFEAWLPKVSSHGVILLHDIAEVQGDFGAKRVWDEINPLYAHFEFMHGHGLGVLAKGGVESPELKAVLESTGKQAAAIRSLFWQLGRAQSLSCENAAKEREIQAKGVQIAGLRSRETGLSAEVQVKERELKAKEAEIANLKAQISSLNSRPHLLLLNRLAPWGTRRRAYFELGMAGIRVLIDEGPRSLWLNYTRYRSRGKIIPTKVDRSSLTILTAPVEDEIVGIDKEVTVVIPTKDAGADFEFTLERIKGAKGLGAIDLVVVDSGSRDGTITLAQDYGARVFTVRPEEFNHGLTRNFGAAQGTGDYVLFMVQDAIPIGDRWLHEMVRVMESDSTIAAATCRQVPRSDADLFACSALWNHYRYLWPPGDTVSSAKMILHDLSPRDKRSLAGLEDVCCVVRRDVFEGLRFRNIAYAEDLDLGLRLVGNGHKIAFLSSTATIHSHNRPPSYLLSRSYVESKALPGMLSYEPPNYFSTGHDPKDMLGSVKMLYAAINAAAATLRTHDESPVTLVADFKSLVQSSLSGGTKLLSDYERAEGQLDEVFDAMRGLVGDMNMTPNELVARQYFASLDDLSLYLRESHKASDDLGAILSAFYKVFSITAGSIIASYFLARAKSVESRESSTGIDRLLSRGV